MSRQQRRGRVYRVPLIVASGEWLKRSLQVFKEGMATGENNAPRSPVPYRHSGLREVWLDGYDAGSQPLEELFRELRVQGELPWDIIFQFPWESDYCQAFKQGIQAAQQNVVVDSSPGQDIVLREFWLAGYEYIKDPERTHNWMREQNWSNMGSPEEEIERLQANIKNMLEGWDFDWNVGEPPSGT